MYRANSAFAGLHGHAQYCLGREGMHGDVGRIRDNAGRLVGVDLQIAQIVGLKYFNSVLCAAFHFKYRWIFFVTDEYVSMGNVPGLHCQQLCKWRGL